MNKKMRALVLVIFALAFCKEGLSAQVTNLLIGSEERVIENGLRNADHIQVYVQQLRADGLYYPVSQDAIGGLNFTNKSYLDSQVALILRRVAQGAVDNDAGQDRDGPFSVSVVAAKRYADIRKTLLFLGGYLGDFKLIKNGDNYSLPDLSGFVVGVPNNVPIRFPSLAWVRIKFVDENGLRIIDSAITKNDPMIDFARSAVILPRNIAISGQVAISVIYGQNMAYFGRFDEDGYLLPEDPPSMSISPVAVSATGPAKVLVFPSTVSISMRGGDIGRTYVVQTKNELGEKDWVTIPDSIFSVNYAYPFVDHHVLTDTGGDSKFYRLLPVKRIPIYDK